jgi:5'-nucleotidase
MRLLISNDDGVFAPGVRTLANTMAAAGHQVTVVCPDRERSATGHGLTLHQPIRANLVDGIFDPRITAWSSSGTPSDCVKLALWSLMEEKPDYVLSGINQGANLGTDVLYSGTVSAAMEGIIEGIPSIALSLTSFAAKDFQPAADYACTLLDHLIHNPRPELILLNVNIPPVSAGQIRGAKITTQGIRKYIEVFEKREDPRGKTYYWLAGEAIEEVADPEADQDIPSDVQAIRDNYITVTPLQYNLTARKELSSLNLWLQSGKF